MAQLPNVRQKTDGFRQAPFLRPDDVKRARKSASHLFLRVEDRSPNVEAAAEGVKGPAMGQYGVDIPVNVDGKEAVISIPEWGDDYANLATAYGTDGSKWIGKEIAFREIPHIKRDGTETLRIEATTPEVAVAVNRKAQGPPQDYLGSKKAKK